MFAHLLAVSRAMVGQMDYESVLRAFGTELRHLIPHDHLDIVLLSKHGKEHACYEVGLLTKWSDLARRPLPTRISPVRAVLMGEVLYLLTDDALSDRRFHFKGAIDEPIFTARLRSRIIVPLRAQGGIFGSLNISRQQTGRYKRADVSIAQHCADLLAPYLYALARTEDARKAAFAEAEARTREEVLRAGALRLTEGMERERQRLAMDLHDQTLADLARISRRIAHLRVRGGARPDDLVELENDLGSCLHELRRIVEDMKPGVLDLFGFAEAIEASLTRSIAGAGLDVAIELKDRSQRAADRLPTTLRTALYRIVQEAVNNAVTHSGARRIRVEISKHSACVEVAIIDDGRGLSGPAETSCGGMSHMRTRAALIGAQIRVARGAGGTGTRVTVRIPLVRQTETEIRAPTRAAPRRSHARAGIHPASVRTVQTV